MQLAASGGRAASGQECETDFWRLFWEARAELEVAVEQYPPRKLVH